MPKVQHRTVIDTRLPRNNQLRQVFIKGKQEPSQNDTAAGVRHISILESNESIVKKKHVTIAEDKNVTVTITEPTGPEEEVKKSKKDKKKKNSETSTTEEKVEMVYRVKQPSAAPIVEPPVESKDGDEVIEKEESKEEENKESN